MAIFYKVKNGKETVRFRLLDTSLLSTIIKTDIVSTEIDFTGA